MVIETISRNRVQANLSKETTINSLVELCREYNGCDASYNGWDYTYQNVITLSPVNGIDVRFQKFILNEAACGRSHGAEIKINTDKKK